jgi:hypothetical protein
MPFLTSALLATPLFVTATRLQRPIAARRVLHHLATLRASLASAPARSTVVVYTGHDGGVLEARLRLSMPAVPAGMGKLELVVTDGSVQGRPRWAFAWLAQCRANSRADALLQRALPNAVREPTGHDEHVVYVAVSVDVAGDASQLVSWLAREALANAA